MKIKIQDISNKEYIFEVENNETIENIKYLLEAETSIPFLQQNLLFNQVILQNNKTLNSYGISDNSILKLYKKPSLQQTIQVEQQQQINQPQNQQMSNSLAQNLSNAFVNYHQQQQFNPIAQKIQQLKLFYEQNPNELHRILIQEPEFAEAVLAEDTTLLEQILMQKEQKLFQQRMQDFQQIQQMNADPFNVENQKKIEEQIKMNLVNDNFQQAQEFNPELFSAVHMLYIDTEINKHPIQAFIDSGAQMTVMSYDTAKRCEITHLIDTRCQGIACGVGQQKIVGKIHLFQLQVGDKFLPCSLTILKGDSIDFIFGLDMLKRFQCNIDLKDNKLYFNGGEFSVSFLAEKDIQQHISIDQEKEMLKLQQSKSFQSNSQSDLENSQQINPNQTNQINRTQNQNSEEQKIQQLVNLGFDKNQAKTALQQCQGNIEMAATLLSQLF